MSVTTIEWTKRPGTIGETWNPTTGCNKVDRGCKNCYAEKMHKRLQAMGQEKYKGNFLDGAVPQPDTLDIPMKWTKPRTVFVNSMSDLFHENVDFAFILEVMQVIQMTPQHTYLVLTKRPEVALEFWEWMDLTIPNGIKNWTPPQNLWLGTSCNDQDSANKRVPILLRINGILRFISYEPATGPVDFKKIVTDSHALDEDGRDRMFHLIDALNGLEADMAYHKTNQVWQGNIKRDCPRLHWVIMGGESGNKAAPMHPAWARKVRDDCQAAGVPFFFKQFGEWAPRTFLEEGKPFLKFGTDPKLYTFTEPPQNMIKVGKHKSGHELDGKIYQQFPNF